MFYKQIEQLQIIYCTTNLRKHLDGVFAGKEYDLGLGMQ